MSIPTLTLPQALERPLGAGHPWVYRDQLPSRTRLSTGTWVRLKAGRFTGYAIYDAGSPLACRIYSDKGVPDADWISERVAEAWVLREPIRARGDTSAYRWIHGEGDGLPGLVVDLYGDAAVVVLDTPAVEGLLEWVLTALETRKNLKAIAVRRRDAADRLQWIEGRASDRRVVEESGLSFVVDFEVGQKTGLFLDQRENRRTVETLSAGRRVLNLFSYTGGFSLYAARGGARAVTSVDVSKGAMDAARASFIESGLDPSRHRFEARDVFEFLESEGKSTTRYDLVVCDPPSFARNQEQLERAERAYVRVNAAALDLVADGGLLATASCTSRLTPRMFERCLAEAGARAGRRLQIVHEAGQALDHPVRVGHPEGRYLKFVVARVLGRA